MSGSRTTCVAADPWSRRADCSASRDVLAAAAPEGVGVGEIIVALIGGLALILVALIPVLITSAKQGASRTTPSDPEADGPTISTEEAERLWAAIERLRHDQQGAALWSAEERGRIEAHAAEARRQIRDVARDLSKLRDGFHRHAGAPTHRPVGPDTDA